MNEWNTCCQHDDTVLSNKMTKEAAVSQPCLSNPLGSWEVRGVLVSWKEIRNKNGYLNIEQSKEYPNYLVSNRWKEKQSEHILQMHALLVLLLTENNSETIATLQYITASCFNRIRWIKVYVYTLTTVLILICFNALSISFQARYVMVDPAEAAGSTTTYLAWKEIPVHGVNCVTHHALESFSPGRFRNVTFHSCRDLCRCQGAGMMHSIAMNMEKTGNYDGSMVTPVSYTG